VLWEASVGPGHHKIQGLFLAAEVLREQEEVGEVHILVVVQVAEEAAGCGGLRQGSYAVDAGDEGLDELPVLFGKGFCAGGALLGGYAVDTGAQGQDRLLVCVGLGLQGGHSEMQRSLVHVRAWFGNSVGDNVFDRLDVTELRLRKRL